jgi:hypothetical protein
MRLRVGVMERFAGRGDDALAHALPLIPHAPSMFQVSASDRELFKKNQRASGTGGIGRRVSWKCADDQIHELRRRSIAAAVRPRSGRALQFAGALDQSRCQPDCRQHRATCSEHPGCGTGLRFPSRSRAFEAVHRHQRARGRSVDPGRAIRPCCRTSHVAFLG